MSSYSPRKSNVRSISKFGHQTEEEKASANEQTRQGVAQMPAEEVAKQRAPYWTMYASEHSSSILQHHINSVFNKTNTVGCE
ncbi:hypothetical protein TNCV_291311 [Trichonephila clavipes]|nr:hypothetical protein TNCV_291311 [Trichonephila clavipes]